MTPKGRRVKEQVKELQVFQVFQESETPMKHRHGRLPDPLPAA